MPVGNAEHPLTVGAEYADRYGWPIFALHTARGGRCSCGNPDCDKIGKHPHWHIDLLTSGLLSATTDQSLIAQWSILWADANVGLVTGQKSHIVVLDIDPRNGGDDSLAELEQDHGKLPYTVVCLSGGGGRHYYFVHPGGYIKGGKIAPGIDIKGEGGYVVMPPSMHASGQRYEWEISSCPGDVAMAPMPAWLVAKTQEDNRTNGQERMERSEYVGEKIHEGARNSRLTSLAGTMRRRGMSEAAILAGLMVTNEESCSPPLGEQEVKRIAHSVARYAPDNPPRLIMPVKHVPCAKWIDAYVEYAATISPMTPRLFHESAALWLLSTAIARRLVLPMAHGNVYPNLYIVWLAPTTLYRKTTGQAIPRGIAERIFPYLLAPQDCTPEAMLNDMAGTEPPNLVQLSIGAQEEWRQQRNFPAQRGLVMDEMSGVLATAGRDYNAGLIEAYLRFYDCESTYKRSTRKEGLQVVKNAFVSILGASTPAAMSQHMMAGRLWAMGWWARFAILTPSEEPLDWHKPEPATEPPEIEQGLRVLLARLPKGLWPTPAEAISVKIVPEAQQIWETYNQHLSFELLKDESLDERFYGTYGRMPTQVLKVAMLLAATDWPLSEPNPVVETRHLWQAIRIAESWRDSSHRAVQLSGQSEYEGLKRRVLRLVSKGGPSGITLRNIARGMQDIKPSVIEAILGELLLSVDIEEEERKAVGRGRPAHLYRLITT